MHLFLIYTVEGVVAYNRDREGNQPDFYDDNGFLVRPAPIGDERPYAPHHGPGEDPYTVYEHASFEDTRISFRGGVNT